MHAFEQQLAQDCPRWLDHATVVAVSGGPDSVALLRALSALRQTHFNPPPLTVAHFHHAWRPEADLDQQFVARLAAACGLEFDTARSEGLSSIGGQGLEAIARRERYAFLLSIAERRGARYIATGHTADDQVETVLQRILRGTGVDGLAGIPRLRKLTPDVVLIRPLLSRWRYEVRRYLDDVGQAYQLDATNEDVRFMRNRLRHDLLPRIRDNYQSHVDSALLRLAEDARDYVQALHQLMDASRPNVVAAHADGVQICRDAFRELTPLMRRLLLRDVWRERGWPMQNMTRLRWLQLADLIAADANGKLTLPGNIRLRAEGATAMITGARGGT